LEIRQTIDAKLILLKLTINFQHLKKKIHNNGEKNKNITFSGMQDSDKQRIG